MKTQPFANNVKASALLFAAISLLGNLEPAQAVQPNEHPAEPIDTGLAQQLRQQITSECYGFVDHDPGLVRGFDVNGSFQLQRDGYPWARFEDTANLLIERQDVLVSGAGLGCASAPPGGAVNLVTRREPQMPSRSTLETNAHGGWSLRHETAPVRTQALNWRLAAREEHWRDALSDRSHTTDLASQLDWNLGEMTRLRLDLEWRNGHGPFGVGWPATDALSEPADRHQSNDTPWSRYRSHQEGSLLALEHGLDADTQLRLGWSRVRYVENRRELYLDPPAGQNGQPPFDAVAYVYPDQRHRFDAWHGELNHRFTAWGASHRSSLDLSALKVGEPDQDRPAQFLGPWQPGTPLGVPQDLPATGERRLLSRETRFSWRHSARWTAWQANAALIASRFRDDNGSAAQSASALSPTLSLAWTPDASWRVQLTSGRGATGRQYASITSDTAQRILPPGHSTEHELGVRWTRDTWSAGIGLFELTRPYRFEQQNVSAWRGHQTHRGLESTLRWAAPDERASIVFTTQALRTQVTGTGDSSLDGKRPPGVPARRGSVYAEARLPAPAWTISILGTAVSKRASFDDNLIFAPGYGRIDAGLNWHGPWGSTPLSVMLTIENLTNRRAWEAAGSGVAYPLATRGVGLTLVIGES